MEVEFILVGIGFILFGGVLIVCFFRKAKLSPEAFERYSREIRVTKKLDPPHAIFEAHKMFVMGLRTLFPKTKSTAAQLINKVSKRFPNEQKVWHFHRLRNRIAHDENVNVTPTQAESARQAFVRALEALKK